MANPVLQCPAFAGPAGPAFFFFCLSQLLSAASLRWRQNHFSLTWGWPLPPDSFTPPHTAPTRLVWGFAGVVPLPGAQKRTQALTGAFSLLRSLCSTFPLRGKAGPTSNPSCSGSPGFVHKRLTLAQQGWSGASLVPFPYPALKTAHRRSQGRVGVISFSWGASAPEALLTPSPACNSPPLGWDEW